MLAVQANKKLGAALLWMQTGLKIYGFKISVLWTELVLAFRYDSCDLRWKGKL